MSKQIHNVRVRFHLVSPLLFPAVKPIRPIQGDGLYGYAWALSKGLVKTPAEMDPANLAEPELPFTLVNDSFFAISSSFAAEGSFLEPTLIYRHADFVQTFAKQDLGKSYVSNQMGEHQAARELYWKLVTPYLDFYAQVTDKEHFRELTKLIWKLGHLGGKRSIGFGEIGKVDVKEKECPNWSVLKEGNPARPIPVAGWTEPIKEELIDFVGYKPPYWNRALYDHCYISPLSFFNFPALPGKEEVEKASAVLGQKQKDFLDREIAKEERKAQGSTKKKGRSKR
ncbi:hypothetical protein [Anaeromusa acidaminophila]|uniref:hypothetical protein n=1 Tax=Anaeromusa acidaminophila TaxID=81464 RepID=UPI00037AEC42|nr:hypothetical protein [Anaeromusa acidaminophila]